MDNERPGDKARKALTACAKRKSHRPEFAAYLSRLNAVQFHVVLHLLTELHISSSAIPELWPVTEPERFEKILNNEIAEFVELNENTLGRH